jgi:hypothetical protein
VDALFRRLNPIKILDAGATEMRDPGETVIPGNASLIKIWFFSFLRCIFFTVHKNTELKILRGKGTESAMKRGLGRIKRSSILFLAVILLVDPAALLPFYGYTDLHLQHSSGLKKKEPFLGKQRL